MFVASLPEGMQSYYRQKGFGGSRRNILFRRFVLEQAGRRMDSFLRDRLNVAEFRLWQEHDGYQQQLLFKLNQPAEERTAATQRY